MMAHHLLPFAEQLRRYRRERGFTQEELAEHAGMSARGIRALELGERGTPHKDTVRLLAEALDLSPDQWVSFERAAAVTATDAALSGPPLPIGGFLGAVPVGPIIARQNEVRRLLAVLDEVTGGAGRLVMLAGEPGVGKTRLAQEVAVVAQAQGYLVASGRCYEPEQAVPYYPFLGALTAVYDGTSPSIRTNVQQRWPYLEWLLPGHPQSIGASEMGSRDVQQRLFWAVSGFLQSVAEAAPVGLLLDDLHWADESSLKLLQHLARQMRGTRVLLLGTYRDIEVGRQRPLEQTLRDLHREGLLEEIPVRRLERSGTAALAATLLGEAEVSKDFAQLLHQHTEGNAFFTQEVMRTLVERGDVFFHDGSWDRRAVEEIEVPRSVRSAIGERISRLSGRAQEVLFEASVLGQAFAFDDLWRMGQRAEEEVEEALEEALAAMVVRATERDEYVFNHALTQQTLYAELSPRRRNRLHSAAGGALAEMTESTSRPRATQIAWHFIQADSAERALPFAILAGDEAGGVFAHSEAEQHYRTALDLARELDDQPREAEALEKLGTILRRLARYEEALDTLERAVDLSAEVGDVVREGRATHEIGIVHYFRGTPEQGIRRVREVEEILVRRAPNVQASRAFADLYAALALDLWPIARYSEVLVAVERAAELAHIEKNTRSRAIAETFRGMALTMVGPLPEARRVLEEATLLFPTVGETWWIANAVGNTGRAYLDEGEFGKGREYLERSRALIVPWHDRDETAWTEGNLGEAFYLAGDWANARITYDGALRMARDVGSGRHLSLVLLHLAELCAAEGNWDEAKQYIDEGLEIGERCNSIPTIRKAQRLLAEHDLAQGQAERAVSRLQPLLRSPDQDWPRAFPPPVLAEAYLAMEDVARAEALVLSRVRRFRTHNHQRALTLWLPVQGMVLNRQQRWSEVTRVFAEAVSLAHAMSYPYAEGRILYEYGLMHVERGEPEQARGWLEQALAIFRNLAARPYIERTEHALDDLR
jgi:tetratricopeptide (TPR) repeat protein/transcriptional regulator with XRE-family HTH domain